MTRSGTRSAFARRWLGAAVVLTALCVAWGLASPIPSGPDEPAQIVKMASVMRGTIVGRPVDGRPATTAVHIPSEIVRLVRRGKCDYKVARPAICRPRHHPTGALARTTTYVGRYPPLYYAVVGIPLLFGSSYDALQASRAMSGLIVGVLLGLAFAVTTTWGRSPGRLVALGLVVTPTVFYLGGVINPSASETAGAVVLWASLAVLLFDQPDPAEQADLTDLADVADPPDRPGRPPGPVLAAAVAGAVAMCASRSLSTFFFAVIVAAAVAMRPAAARQLWRWPRTKLAAGAAFGFAWLCGLFVLAARSYKVEAFPFKGHHTSVYYAERIIGSTRQWVNGVIATFGSPNFGAPSPVMVIWVGGAIALGAAVVALCSRPDRYRLGALTALLGFVVPFAIVYSHVQVDGPAWEGRYSLPMIAGLPLLAVGALEGRRPWRSGRLGRHGAAGAGEAAAAAEAGGAVGRLSTLALAAMLVGQVASLYWLLRRYTIGMVRHHANAFDTSIPHWTPLVSAPVLFGVAVACYLGWAGWLRREAGRLIDSRRDDPDPSDASVPAPPTRPAEDRLHRLVP